MSDVKKIGQRNVGWYVLGFVFVFMLLVYHSLASAVLYVAIYGFMGAIYETRKRQVKARKNAYVVAPSAPSEPSEPSHRSSDMDEEPLDQWDEDDAVTRHRFYHHSVQWLNQGKCESCEPNEEMIAWRRRNGFEIENFLAKRRARVHRFGDGDACTACAHDSMWIHPDGTTWPGFMTTSTSELPRKEQKP